MDQGGSRDLREEDRRYQLHLLLGREDLGGKPPISPTDIITFDYTEGNKISGDLFISLDTVRTNAETFHTDYNEELHRTIIHGILHLCGINDKGPGEREIMEENENRALAILPEECR